MSKLLTYTVSLPIALVLYVLLLTEIGVAVLLGLVFLCWAFAVMPYSVASAICGAPCSTSDTIDK